MQSIYLMSRKSKGKCKGCCRSCRFVLHIWRQIWHRNTTSCLGKKNHKKPPKKLNTMSSLGKKTNKQKLNFCLVLQPPGDRHTSRLTFSVMQWLFFPILHIKCVVRMLMCHGLSIEKSKKCRQWVASASRILHTFSVSSLLAPNEGSSSHLWYNKKEQL